MERQGRNAGSARAGLPGVLQAMRRFRRLGWPGLASLVLHVLLLLALRATEPAARLPAAPTRSKPITVEIVQGSSRDSTRDARPVPGSGATAPTQGTAP